MLIKAGLVVLLFSFALPMFVGKSMSDLAGIGLFVGMALMGIGAFKGRSKTLSSQDQARSQSPLSSEEFANSIILNAKLLTNNLGDVKKLSNTEYKNVIFSSLALMYLLIDQHALLFMSSTKRITFSNRVRAGLRKALARVLGAEEDYITEFLNPAIKRLEPYAHHLVKTPKGRIKGTLFYEYGVTIERLTHSKISQIESMIVATEIGMKLLDKLQNAPVKHEGKTGLGGWLAVFIINAVLFTVLGLGGVIVILIVLINANYSMPDSSIGIIVSVLSLLYYAVVGSLGVWLLVLLSKGRKLAIKVGVAFSLVSLNLGWALYIHNSKRVKNTLTK